MHALFDPRPKLPTSRAAPPHHLTLGTNSPPEVIPRRLKSRPLTSLSTNSTFPWEHLPFHRYAPLSAIDSGGHGDRPSVNDVTAPPPWYSGGQDRSETVPTHSQRYKNGYSLLLHDRGNLVNQKLRPLRKRSGGPLRLTPGRKADAERPRFECEVKLPPIQSFGSRIPGKRTPPKTIDTVRFSCSSTVRRLFRDEFGCPHPLSRADASPGRGTTRCPSICSKPG